MRRRLLMLLLAAAMLSGCGLLEGSYVSLTPHQVDIHQSAVTGARQVGTLTELRSALVALVDSGSTEGLFSMAEYPRNQVVEDMEKMVAYVMDRYPLGAYAVESISYDFGTGLGGSAMSVDVVYRSGISPVAEIRTVRRIAGAQEAIHTALDDCAESLVLQVTGYQEEDFIQMVKDYAAQNPDRVMEVPAVSLSIYPDGGDTRVVELQFRYQTAREELRAMREQVQPVFSMAALYVTGDADERTKFSQLHAFLTERFQYTMESTDTPAYSLLCLGVGDSRAFAQVYAAMCNRIGLQAGCVEGTLDGKVHWWNQICIGEEWYHVDLLSSRRFRVLRDDDMVGYAWDQKELRKK